MVRTRAVVSQHLGGTAPDEEPSVVQAAGTEQKGGECFHSLEYENKWTTYGIALGDGLHKKRKVSTLVLV